MGIFWLPFHPAGRLTCSSWVSWCEQEPEHRAGSLLALGENGSELGGYRFQFSGDGWRDSEEGEHSGIQYGEGEW